MDLDAPDTRARIASFLRAAAESDSLRITRLERMSGGAIQENWALDVEVEGGAHAGAQRWVLRTDAAARVEASLRRSEEFQILRAAHGAGLHAPQPLWSCEDPGVTGREFF